VVVWLETRYFWPMDPFLFRSGVWTKRSTRRLKFSFTRGIISRPLKIYFWSNVNLRYETISEVVPDSPRLSRSHNPISPRLLSLIESFISRFKKSLRGLDSAVKFCHPKASCDRQTFTVVDKCMGLD